MEKARNILEKVKSEGRKILTEYESKNILRLYNIPTTTEIPVDNVKEAIMAAYKINFPVALKINSPDIIHKTDVGGVRLNIKTEDEVKIAFHEIVENVKKHRPEARIIGVLVQSMAPTPIQELFVGMKRDPQFGPVLAFGVGGIFIEVLKDVVLRLPPLSKDEALSMISEIRCYPILTGLRGRPPIDLNAIADIITKTSKLVMDLPEIAEMDINPIFAYEKGAMAVDARIVLV